MKKIKERTIFFDMDGTIADLYGQENWLKDLRSNNTRPYELAKPLYSMDKLNSLLIALKSFGYRIGVITWGAKNATKDYDKEVRRVKREWINTNFPVCQEFHYQSYGTPKTKATYQNVKINKDILIDDNAEIRAQWEKKGGIAINPDENLFSILAQLIS